MKTVANKSRDDLNSSAKRKYYAEALFTCLPLSWP